MLDRHERMNAKRKEDTGFSDTVDQHDREFAVDTWTQAAFDEDEERSRRRIHYDPHSLTERYSGEEDRVENDFSERLDGVVLTREDRAPVTVRRDDDIEAAAEIAEPIPSRRSVREISDDEDSRESGASGIGMTGLGLSILSLFLMPYLVAPIGMVLGYLAYRRDSRTLGAWAMIVGAISILGALVIYPYYTAR
ncbi:MULTISPECIES: DUF456 domain-containing protein [Brevibacillus]|jgi:Tetrahydromethanopterin S-methyltransferase, subunit C|uniref:DUF456 domain-containing protein n=1 Tax=Brevibacillus parabrevis TaxID=54914 RepID=A0A4Y3PEN7_BREPA|nr:MULTISPECIES: DUF456 domain-containing protein [Brevibacillus]MBU8714307.1 DUF456 domain-containing protein [Brevibacillus parabrevis]MDH6351475.1 hypothetical protein [Brevibacillus sp. 1238]NRQ57071.1 DUF456 domain-containing protein [Brevibacillus sp. HD1.4A]RNB95783.1 DUF456 domain-containing protein [Brevibacillus parabrevis]UED67524.1 DUF456 domain-containing protein [Brevibacillus sp. HD3.3A]